jgi:hypothetical protein
VAASKIGRSNQHLAELRIQWKLGHHLANVCHVSFVIQGAQVIQELQGAHHGLGCRRVHKVKVNQVVDAELFELQHNSRQIGAKDFRIGLWNQVVAEALFRVQAEALNKRMRTYIQAFGTSTHSRQIMAHRHIDGDCRCTQRRSIIPFQVWYDQHDQHAVEPKHER